MKPGIEQVRTDCPIPLANLLRPVYNEAVEIDGPSFDLSLHSIQRAALTWGLRAFPVCGFVGGRGRRRRPRPPTKSKIPLLEEGGSREKRPSPQHPHQS